jgi:glycerophosphoryl diester phosphodiesterase
MNAAPAAASGRAEALMAKIENPNGGVVVIAHRGCHNRDPRAGLADNAPENSIAGLDRCVKIGVDVMELDIRRTVDGYLVVMHDESVDRTTDGHGKVATLSLAQLRALHLKQDEGGAKAALTDQRVSTLDEMLAASENIVLNLDVKAAIYDEVVDAVRRAGAGQRVIVKNVAGSGSPALAGIEPYRQVPFMPILSSADPAGSDLAKVAQQQGGASKRPVAYELPYMDGANLPALAAEARRQGVRLWNNSLWQGFIAGYGGDIDALRDPDGVWGGQIRAGISAIQTDEPASLLRYLRQNGDKTDK